jgi:hypothetical protein
MSVDWLRFDGAGRALAGQAWASQTSFAGTDGLSSPAWGVPMRRGKSKNQNPNFLLRQSYGGQAKETSNSNPQTGDRLRPTIVGHSSRVNLACGGAS